MEEGRQGPDRLDFYDICCRIVGEVPSEAFFLNPSEAPRSWVSTYWSRTTCGAHFAAIEFASGRRAAMLNSRHGLASTVVTFAVTRSS